ncbi:hypothetical protein C8J56DRAFT_884695 [Mycena floridula]|nr:hypothetical protein C8J56DRAFT_884695 [Mycena floridula]
MPSSTQSSAAPDIRTVTPNDTQIHFQIYQIRSQHLKAPLGFQKMLDALKAAEPTWILGPIRFKKLLKKLAEEEEEEVERKASGSHYRIIGHDGCDYAVTPNSDMAIFLNVMQKRAVEDPRQRPNALYNLWLHLEPAAKKAGVPLNNLRAQLTGEYGMDPLTDALSPPKSDAERAAHTAQFERKKQEYNLCPRHPCRQSNRPRRARNLVVLQIIETTILQYSTIPGVT